MTAGIQNLKKVTLSLNADRASGKDTITDSPVAFVFIYGVASDGLCPFEGALYEKSAGESLTITVSAAEAHDFFGHLFLPLRQVLGLQVMPQSITLLIKITAVSTAENREIVQSLAKAGSGCGGSCGCGC